ncbi:MAG: 50S ribosomal protein L23 [Chloroflexi bacterium]|nr:50S ribosomal protein L23 [Chloroflexota bacterium]
MNTWNVIKRPLITEKATALKEQGKYVFEVDENANRSQVKLAVELAFNVKVDKVQMINRPGKMKRFGGRRMITPTLKKAVVSLVPGNKIEFFEGI